MSVLTDRQVRATGTYKRLRAALCPHHGPTVNLDRVALLIARTALTAKYGRGTA